MKKLFSAMLRELEQGRASVLCSILASSGSSPRGAGAKMAVFADGQTIGTIGGGNVEHLATLEAQEILRGGEEKIRAFCLAPNQVADIGMICGGAVTVHYRRFLPERAADHALLAQILALLSGDTDAWLELQFSGGALTSMRAVTRQTLLAESPDGNLPARFGSRAFYTDEYYVEPLVRSGTVYIFGAGHVGQALAPVLAKIGFRTAIFDAREALANESRFPDADRILCAPFAELSQHVQLKPEDYAVIMTPAHQDDFTVLRQVLKTDATYIGCIGSRKKIARTNERLFAEGFTEADVQRVHSPIGLAIGAETPEEIAISIAAELIAHRAARQ